MPWHVGKHADCAKPFAVIKDDDGSLAGCHDTKAKAQKQLAALYAKEGQMSNARPPRENLVRAFTPTMGEYEVRDTGDGPPTLVGHFAVFNEWTEIDSAWEGRFLEQVAPGAFKRTFNNNRDRIRVTFNHGQDPDLGDKVLGNISKLAEDDVGASYEVPLFRSVPPLIMDGLRAGVYGSSFRFRVLREEIADEPEASDHNPMGLPERTIREAEVMEFGPVTYPAYEGATAGVRSLTDEFLFGELTKDPARLVEVIEHVRATKESSPAAATSTRSPLGVKDIPTADKKPKAPEPKAEEKEEEEVVDIDRFNTLELLAARADEIRERKNYLHAEYAGKEFPPEVQGEWDSLKDEQNAIARRQEHLRDRERDIAQAPEGQKEPGDDRGPVKTFGTTVPPVENPYNLEAIRQSSSTEEKRVKLVRDSAKRSIETSVTLVGPSHEDSQTKAERTLAKLDHEGRLAEYYLATGSPTYRQAFMKFAMSAPMAPLLTPAESNAIELAKGYTQRAFTLTSTGLPVPYQLDPTVIPTSNGSVNPFRAISRVVQTTQNEWRGATSGGITAQYETEAAEAPDDTPTLAQPAISANRADAFVPFSFEVGQDWPAIEAEMAQEVADAKDDLEASKFTTGTGTNEPQGIIVGTTGVLTITTTTAAFVVADTYKVEEALAPRFRPRASFMGNRAILNKVRQFDSAGGSANWLPVPGLGAGLNNQFPTPGNVGYGILGYPTYENSAMDSVLTTGSEILVFGDFRGYVIVDRIGMSVDLIPNLVGTNHRPTGQRGLYFFWRNGAEVLSNTFFRVLQT